ncbi:1075_t:CDS:2 [Funneliformis geosporum]|uniref:1075_t:CDS:1 n=1 Tax=Funneliformis geosporum TaxID=1117311 RepID=A0A9W4STA1_9GLOM|nr:1075_t:CDS:2 [Funneliformis geosporum]
MSWDIRFVVGLYFGTKHSGFAYCHVCDDNIRINEDWPRWMGNGQVGQVVQFKTNTVLQYDSNLNVKYWGYPALYKRPRRNFDEEERSFVAELFTLHLDDLQESQKPVLPNGLDYKKAIVDYLHEMGNVVINIDIDFLEQVLLVLTIPAEYSEKAKSIMRDCVHEAGLIGEKNSDKLQLITETEALAIHCRDSLGEHGLNSGKNFMVVDCRSGSIVLTTRKLLYGNRLEEVKERTSDFCGGSFVDREFINYLRRELGNEAIDLLRDNFHGQMQYLVQSFCQDAKLPFKGDDRDFYYEINLEEVSPVLLQYVRDERKQRMEAAEWFIYLDYNTIKSMFDPVIERILRMMRVHIENASGVDEYTEKKKTDIIFLVGGFSESGYLQKRIREEFPGHNIYVPTYPNAAAISRGATIYGLGFNEIDRLDMDGQFSNIESRLLQFTYGIKFWKSDEGFLFKCLARRGKEVKINEEFSVRVRPSHPFQSTGIFEIYYTRSFSAKTCEEAGMKLLGKLKIDWSDGMDRTTTFKLAFGRMELKAIAKNEINGQTFQTSFDFDDE